MAKNIITKAVVRMYCMGTGDCFIVKFFSGEEQRFTMMIDCGVWTGSKERLLPYVKDLKQYVNGTVDLLVVTHEHKDHVSVFESCVEEFSEGFVAKRIWMGWSENDDLEKIAQWKKDYGEKKKALAIATDKIKEALSDPDYSGEILKAYRGTETLRAKETFSTTLDDFANLHVSPERPYKGLLGGMEVVKKTIGSTVPLEFKYPGDIVENLPGLDNVRFYILGPPTDWKAVEAESGIEGESYRHNNAKIGMDAFAASLLSTEATFPNTLPFDSYYEVTDGPTVEEYNEIKERWRTIDHDWLFSAGSLALRINGLTNNLSLVLAIEIESSKKVMLFPGDAEYGSWASWHTIDWKGRAGDNEKPLVEDLLNRTVFYKVAHHTSHNGTAQRLGLEMMKHKDLVAMATLDYDVIPSGWTGTMPNRTMVTELLRRTKGRLIVMNERGLFLDQDKTVALSSSIREAQKTMSAKEVTQFNNAYVVGAGNLYKEYTVDLT